MLIRVTEDNPIHSSEITSETCYRNRRQFLRQVGLVTAASAVTPLLVTNGYAQQRKARKLAPLVYDKATSAMAKDGYYTSEKITPFSDATNYNNFFEYGVGKGDPAKHAWRLQPKPWSINVTGAVERPGKYVFEDIIKEQDIVERIYRMRCVEAWSMVIPWLGIPLAKVIKKFRPTSAARYVVFKTLYDPDNMPGQRSLLAAYEWPYIEGLRIDEAMHPLSLLAIGMYGKEIPNQNGAPIRLVVPWKYGFKGIKSIVSIHFTNRRPRSTWEIAASSEYGFYANVNPQVDHPRWSQARERRLPAPLFGGRIATQMFNGYAEQVAHLYTGMDLRVNF